MSLLRAAYKALSVASTAKAAVRGPKALGRNLVRRKAHRGLARTMRRWGL